MQTRNFIRKSSVHGDHILAAWQKVLATRIQMLLVTADVESLLKYIFYYVAQFVNFLKKSDH